jgi:hypothetical protein
MPIVLASIALTALITGFLFKRKTEGEDSDELQDILEDELLGDDTTEEISSSEKNETLRKS